MIDFVNIAVMLGLLIFSVIVHELAHGYIAFWLGDSTAKRTGRLSFNPLVHVDPVGSIALPLLLLCLHSPVWFAWAKPVPVSTRLLRSPDSDLALIALAGPLSNFTLAFIASVLMKVLSHLVSGVGLMALIEVLVRFVYLNCALAVFNLLPIPPLDGSKVIARFLPYRVRVFMNTVSPYGIGILIILSMTGYLGGIVSGITMPIGRFLTYGI